MYKILLNMSCICYIVSFGTGSIKMCYFGEESFPKSSLQCDSRRLDRLCSGLSLRPRVVRSEGSERLDFQPSVERNIIEKRDNVRDAVSYSKVRWSPSNGATGNFGNSVLDSEDVKSSMFDPKRYASSNELKGYVENAITNFRPIGYLQKWVPSGNGFRNVKKIGSPLEILMKQLVPLDSENRHEDAIVDYKEVECPIRYVQKRSIPSDVINKCIGNGVLYTESIDERPTKQLKKRLATFEGVTNNVLSTLFDVGKPRKCSFIWPSSCKKYCSYVESDISSRLDCPMRNQKLVESSGSLHESISKGAENYEWAHRGFKIKAKATTEPYCLKFLDIVSEGIGVSTTLGRERGSCVTKDSVTKDSAASRNKTKERERAPLTTTTQAPQYKICVTVMPNPTNIVEDMTAPESTMKVVNVSTHRCSPTEVTSNKCTTEVTTKKSPSEVTSDKCTTEVTTKKSPSEITTKKTSPKEVTTKNCSPKEVATKNNCTPKEVTTKNYCTPKEVTTKNYCTPKEVTTKKSSPTDVTTKKSSPNEVTTKNCSPNEVTTKNCSNEVTTKKSPTDITTKQSCPTEVTTKPCSSTKMFFYIADPGYGECCNCPCHCIPGAIIISLPPFLKGMCGCTQGTTCGCCTMIPYLPGIQTR